MKGRVSLNEILCKKNYIELIEQYIDENNENINKIIDILKKNEVIDKNKVISIYKAIYKINDSYLEEIDFNLAYKHEIEIEKLFNWLLEMETTENIKFKNIKNKICKDKNKCWKMVFKELIEYNNHKEKIIISIVSDLMLNYKNEHVKKLKFELEEIVLVLKKLNYIINISPDKLLELYIDITNEKKIPKQDFKKYIDIYLYNYPYEAISYTKNNKKEKNEIEKYIEDYCKNWQDEYNIKKNILDIKGSEKRIISYQKENAKNMHDIEEQGKKNSIFFNWGSNKTIMYGKNIIYVSPDGNIHNSSFYTIHKSVAMPYEYIIDPVVYRLNTIRVLNERLEK